MALSVDPVTLEELQCFVSKLKPKKAQGNHLIDNKKIENSIDKITNYQIPVTQLV